MPTKSWNPKGLRNPKGFQALGIFKLDAWDVKKCWPNMLYPSIWSIKTVKNMYFHGWGPLQYWLWIAQTFEKCAAWLHVDQNWPWSVEESCCKNWPHKCLTPFFCCLEECSLFVKKFYYLDSRKVEVLSRTFIMTD